MPTGEELAPRIPEHCSVCGEALGTSYWVNADRGATHEQCMDWTTARSPINALLVRLRRVRRRLARAVRAIDVAGVAIAALDRRWPRDALPALAKMRAVITELEQKLREVAVDVKW